MKIKSPEKRKDLDQLSEITTQIFGAANYFENIQRNKNECFQNSHYDWNSSKIGVIDQQIVTHWGVFGYEMRVGDATLKTAGIGAVITHPDFRRRGLLIKTAVDSLESIKDEGYDFSVLFGIPGFYHKLGYQKAWSSDTYRLSPPSEPVKFKTFKMPKKLYPAMDLIYNQENHCLVGTAVHPTYKKPRSNQEVFGWKNSDGSLRGYVVVLKSSANIICQEAGGPPVEIVKVLQNLAQTKNTSKIIFSSLSYYSQLAKYLRNQDCILEMMYRSNSGPMIRLINLRTTLKKISSELTNRVKTSYLKDWTGTMVICSDQEEVGLEIKNSTVRVIEAKDSQNRLEAGLHLAQLIIGIEEPDDLISDDMLKGSHDFRSILKVLFPDCKPQLGQGDHF